MLINHLCRTVRKSCGFNFDRFVFHSLCAVQTHRQGGFLVQNLDFYRHICIVFKLIILCSPNHRGILTQRNISNRSAVRITLNYLEVGTQSCGVHSRADLTDSSAQPGLCGYCSVDNSISKATLISALADNFVVRKGLARV